MSIDNYHCAMVSCNHIRHTNAAGQPGTNEKEHTMTTQDWRNLRNHLMTLACTVSTWSPVYANLNRRIKWINDNRL